MFPLNVFQSNKNDGLLDDNKTSLTAAKDFSLNKKDFFIWKSTIEGYKAIRNPIDGSPFIKAILTSFKEYAYKYDLFQIYLKVNMIMKELKNASLSTLYSVATKKFYFKISEK